MPAFTPAILATERLTLRWLDERDTPALFAIFSDPQVARYWSSGAWTGMAEADEWIASRLEGYRDGSSLCFGAELTATRELIGNVTLRRFNEQNHRCELGYAFARAHWGKGYATEGLAAMLDYGFRVLELNRVEADIDPRNAGSARVLERLHFRKEGYMPERWIVNGEIADTAYYGLLKRYWSES